MTIKQVFLKSFYPVFNAFAKAAGKNNKVYKSTNMAMQSFYDLSTELNNGTTLSFSDLKNKKVMLVNTASDCGYTRQYEGLQALQEKYKNELVIVGFPANDFGEQEKGSDDAIASFCKVNFGVTFPLAKKATVVKQPGQHEVYKWLTTEAANGWNDMAPSWNFCKYLVDEHGNLTHFFEAGIEPTGKEITKAIEEETEK